MGAHLSSLAGEAQVADAAESGPEVVRRLIGRTLAAGEFRLVIAVDHITGELRDIIAWLNAHTSAKVAVLGLEIGHVEHGEVELVVSDVYGEESAATKRATAASPSHRWTEEELRAAMEGVDPALATSLRRLFDHMQGHAKRDSWYWGDGKTPSVTPRMVSPGGATQPWSMYVGGEAGTRPLYINFDWIHRRGNGFADEAVARFADRLAVLPEMSSFASEARQSHWAKRPGIREEVLKNPGVVDGLIDALDELYDDPIGPASTPLGDPEP